MKNGKSVRVGIFGHYGTQNLGDEASIRAVIQGIKDVNPDCAIYGFSMNPKDTLTRHQIKSFPIRRVGKNSFKEGRNGARGALKKNAERDSFAKRLRAQLRNSPLLLPVARIMKKGFMAFVRLFRGVGFFYKSFRNVGEVDLLVIAGSNQLMDLYGGSAPYTIFKWSLMAKMRGKKLVFLNNGVGPVDGKIGGFLIKQALSLADYRSFRDKSSRQLAEKLGVKGENSVFPDLAFGLKVNLSTPWPEGRGVLEVHPEPRSFTSPSKAGLRAAERVNSDSSKFMRTCERRIVAINPIPFYDYRYWPEPDERLYREYIEKLASFALWLGKEEFAVLLFPTKLPADSYVINDIVEMMKEAGGRDLEQWVYQPKVNDVDDLISHISTADMVVASRFHAIVISQLLNKPVLALSYQQKITDLMSDLSQTAYMLDMYSLTATELIETFSSLVDNFSVTKDLLHERTLEYRKRLQSQYGGIFAPNV